MIHPINLFLHLNNIILIYLYNINTSLEQVQHKALCVHRDFLVIPNKMLMILDKIN